MGIQDTARARIAEAYYGPNAAVGDGVFLDMLMKFFMSLLGSCPLGARRAHNMISGGRFRSERARRVMEYRAYEWTGGDAEVTAKIVETGIAVAEKSTAQEFVEFASQ